MTAGDEWVQVAMTDDSLVVELLLKLNQPEPLPAPRRRRRFPQGLVKEGAVLALSVDWSVRQRRSSSKHVLMTRRKKGSDSSAHASPSTPFSFSCATSVSGGGDGFDEATTSLPSKSIATSRSKVAVPSETPTTKRSRKKKTLVELREEESLLLKERRHLKNKLATLHVTVEKERATNGRLKRMKLDFLSQQRPEVLPASVKSEDDIPILPQEKKVACDNIYSILLHNVSFPLQEVEGTSSSFLLPDLNLPVEGDSGSGVLN
ncbi:hypothetical protein SADUNF_Sadunf17G0049600 [Salix dunnii]|uniref:BZIP domain-containing protein n=1 Tax=Salix dunnii TaxID=1413687 RepID=A0A835J7Z6_9ROSI|nr:hypothetical protein SADUNF_Sadunf17G0049600 [Salix dunnii]